MNKTLDEFINGSIKINGKVPLNHKNSKKRLRYIVRLKSTRLDQFLPNEQVEYFKALRIGSKRVQRMKILEIPIERRKN